MSVGETKLHSMSTLSDTASIRVTLQWAFLSRRQLDQSLSLLGLGLGTEGLPECCWFKTTLDHYMYGVDW